MTIMRRIIAQPILHKKQLYPTVGNYVEAHGLVHFTISELGDEYYEMLVLLHEIVEYMLVKKRGIPLVKIDEFDKQFETNRDPGDESEPGDAPEAPYRREHRFAENIERLVCAELGIVWDDYNRVVLELS
jgi:hypothetical protein